MSTIEHQESSAKLQVNHLIADAANDASSKVEPITNGVKTKSSLVLKDSFLDFLLFFARIISITDVNNPQYLKIRIFIIVSVGSPYLR